MSRRHPDRPPGQMGRPAIVVRISSKLRGWTPKRTGRPTKREAYLFRRVDELVSGRKPKVVTPKAVVRCPECHGSFQLFSFGARTPRSYMRSKIMDHAKRIHPWMSVREQSLLADRAVEGLIA